MPIDLLCTIMTNFYGQDYERYKWVMSYQHLLVKKLKAGKARTDKCAMLQKTLSARKT